MLIKGDKIVLRSVDSSDIDTILLWENSSDEPLYGIYEERYSREDVTRFVELQQNYPISVTEQLRLMICLPEGVRIGAIDLTDYNGEEASVSIIIFDKKHRHKGFGEEALRLLIDYAKRLDIKRLNALVHEENEISQRLFLKVGFSEDI